MMHKRLRLSPLEEHALQDAHARWHDMPGNMIGEECAEERCYFWPSALEVISAIGRAMDLPRFQPAPITPRRHCSDAKDA